MMVSSAAFWNMLMHRTLIGEAEAGLTVKFIENHTKQKNSDALTE